MTLLDSLSQEVYWSNLNPLLGQYCDRKNFQREIVVGALEAKPTREQLRVAQGARIVAAQEGQPSDQICHIVLERVLEAPRFRQSFFITEAAQFSFNDLLSLQAFGRTACQTAILLRRDGSLQAAVSTLR